MFVFIFYWKKRLSVFKTKSRSFEAIIANKEDYPYTGENFGLCDVFWIVVSAGLERDPRINQDFMAQKIDQCGGTTSEHFLIWDITIGRLKSLVSYLKIIELKLVWWLL